MNDLRKAAQMALEALEGFVYHGIGPNSGPALASLRAALAQPEQEPVAYQWLDTSVTRKRVPKGAEADAWQPLYTTPLPCPTCEALARTVMMDQTGRDA